MRVMISRTAAALAALALAACGGGSSGDDELEGFDALQAACESHEGEGVNHEAIRLTGIESPRGCPRLGDYGLFEADGEGLLLDGDPRHPREQGVPFVLTTPLFSDYTVKYRALYLPPEETEGVDPDEVGELQPAVYAAAEGELSESNTNFEFPVGTVISKTFTYPYVPGLNGGDTGVCPDEAPCEQIIETRLLIKHENRGDGPHWEGLPYLWVDAGPDGQKAAELHRTGAIVEGAFRYPEPGTGKTLSGSNSRYAVPQAAQCSNCHGSSDQTPGSAPIGLKARNLNRPYAPEFDAFANDAHPGLQGRNQLEYWVEQGFLIEAPALQVANGVAEAVERIPPFNDASQDLEARARGYLESNCAHCHNPLGRPVEDLFLESMRDVCNPNFAIGQNVIEPGEQIDPDAPDAEIASELYRRIDRLGSENRAMPNLARHLVHEEGVALIREWIGAMDPEICATTTTAGPSLLSALAASGEEPSETAIDETPPASVSTGTSFDASEDDVPDHRIEAGPGALRQALQALDDAVDGDVIELGCGYFEMDAQLELRGRGDVTIRGCGRDETVISFAGSPDDGGLLFEEMDGVTIEGLSVVDASDAGIRVRSSEGVTLRDVRAMWSSAGEPITAGNYRTASDVACPGPADAPGYLPSSRNGRYGVHVTGSSAILLDAAEAIGASDIGIHLESSEDAIIRNSRAAFNSAGFGIGNTSRADLHGSVSECNGAGVVLLNRTERASYGEQLRVFDNLVQHNNDASRAREDLIARMPSGLGVLVLAKDRIEIRENEIHDHGTFNILVVSQALLAADGVVDDRQIDPYPDGVHIHDNRLAGAGGAPDLDNAIVRRLLRANEGAGAHIAWDGLLDDRDAACALADGVTTDERGKPQYDDDPEPACRYNRYKFDETGARIKPQFWLCLSANGVADADAPEFFDFARSGAAPQHDITPHRCERRFGETLPALPPVDLERR